MNDLVVLAAYAVLRGDFPCSWRLDSMQESYPDYIDALNSPSLCHCSPAIAVNTPRGVIGGHIWHLQVIPTVSSRSVLRSSVSSIPTGTWTGTISRPYLRAHSGVSGPWKGCKSYFFHVAFSHNPSPPTVLQGTTDNQPMFRRCD